MVDDGNERWLQLGPATGALSLLNVAGFVAVSANDRLAELLGLPEGWGELVQRPWTAVTVLFTSGHVTHLLAAVAVLVVAGGALERRVGPAGVLAVYLLSGLAAAAAMATAASLGVDTAPVSFGASGAFLGLVAALAALPPTTPTLARLSLHKAVVVIVVVNLVAPVAGLGDGTSSVAHLAGLAVGALWSVGSRTGRDVPGARR